MKTSCIQLPSNDRFIVARKSYLDICDGNFCAAELLAFLVNRLDYLIDVDAPKLMRLPNKELRQRLFNRYCEPIIRKAISLLASIGFISTHENPDPSRRGDRSYFFAIHIKAIQDALNNFQNHTSENSNGVTSSQSQAKYISYQTKEVSSQAKDIRTDIKDLYKETYKDLTREQDAQEREGAHGYLCDSKSFEPENPETATDRGQDTDLEPLRKAKVIQNPEPETALQDCPSQPIGIQAKTFRNSEQNLSSPAGTNNQPSTRNSNLEETNIPPAAAGNLPQEAASTLAEVPKPIPPSSSGLTARFSHEADYHNNPVIQEAIDTYNQFRCNWRPCKGMSPTSKRRLLQIYSRQLGDPETKKTEFLSLIRDALLWVNKDDYYNGSKEHKGRRFSSKSFGFLIGEYADSERLSGLAWEWRSLPEEELVGAALKITAAAGKKEFFDLEGKECSRGWCKSIWWDISDAAIKGEPITQEQENWAKYYFPNYDIRVGDDNLL